MANIFDYIDKYGNKTFEEKKFNELDNIVFSFLAYLDYTDTDINTIENSTIQLIGKQYLKQNRYRTIKKYGFSEKDAYKILLKIINKKRYKDIIMEDYIYNICDMQFSVVTFKITKKLNYIAFEGTDQLMTSWKESANIINAFLVKSHYEAIKYLNDHIKLNGPQVIIGGHSKGGNIAAVSSLYIKPYKKKKIKKIYNNDGPGFRLDEFKSFRYKTIRKKYVHIIPSNSMIGILLRTEKYKVVRTSSISFFSHTMSKWLIKDDKLIETKLSKKHKKLEKEIITWIENHNEYERKIIITNIFNILKKYNIEDIMSLIKIKNIIKVIKELKNIDEESKDLILDFIDNCIMK